MNRIETLLAKLSDNSLNQEEFDELCELLKDSELKTLFTDALLDGFEKAPFSYLGQEQLDVMLHKVLIPEAKVVPIKRYRWLRVTAAAAIFMLAFVGIWYYYLGERGKVKSDNINAIARNDIEAPKATKAMITLSDGRLVALDSLQNGTLALQGNTQVVKNERGEIVYQSAGGSGQSIVDRRQTIDASTTLSMTYNTLINPRGSKVVSLTLSDGTKVWLNAESSLKYPVAFNGSIREVAITGEAYFEVATNLTPNPSPKERGKRVPFHVKLPDGSIVEDLSTEFNINAYADEAAIKTTLVEGAVKWSTVNGQSSIVKQGEQGMILRQIPLDKIHVIKDADVEQATAWKNGLFAFNKASLQDVLRQLSKWYDVDVTYEGGVPVREFAGEMERNLSLQQVLTILEKNQVHFRIEGKKIIVEK
ncbi:MAG: DUF4974 domain-containing protein [Sphingobacteriia bacterium]|nr:DUF4974 domain-containing protein [Sphingobacteriia bacterium]